MPAMPTMPVMPTMPTMPWTMVYLLSMCCRMQRGLLCLCTQTSNYFHGKQNVKSEQNNPDTGEEGNRDSYTLMATVKSANTREKLSISHGTILLLLNCLGQKSSKI